MNWLVQVYRRSEAQISPLAAFLQRCVPCRSRRFLAAVLNLGDPVARLRPAERRAADDQVGLDHRGERQESALGPARPICKNWPV